MQDRRLYVAALGVALGGLVLDRLVLSGAALGPGTAEAAPQAGPAPAGRAISAPATLPADTTVQLADRLKQLEQSRSLDLAAVRDAFWLDGVSRAEAKTEPTTTEQAIAAFAETHTLRAVVSGPTSGFVVVGEKRLEIGDTLDGFTLTEVEAHPRRRAVFNFDGRSVELTMDPKISATSGG